MEVMPANTRTAFSAPLVVIFVGLGIQLCWGQDDSSSPSPDDYYTYYQPKSYDNYGDNYYGHYDYENPEVENLCYVCHYLIKDGHGQGFENCRDPFNSDSIPQVVCRGPCSKSYYKQGDMDYTVQRQCMPNCKNLTQADYYVQCCTSRLCNGAQGSDKVEDKAEHKAPNHVTLHLISIATAICRVLIFLLL